MYKWEKPIKTKDYDPTFSSSLLNQINKSHLKTEQTKNKRGVFLEEKNSSLRRPCIVEKWMDKRKVSSKSSSSSSFSTKRTTLLDEFDVQDTLFFSTSSKKEYSVYFHARTNPNHPQIPKPIRTTKSSSYNLLPFDDQTRAIESRYLNEEVYVKSRSRAQKIYSDIKSLKQPISPGLKLSNFLTSIFTKDGKKRKEQQGSTCSSTSSISRSCLSKNSSPRGKFNDGVKRSVKFCPVNVVINDNNDNNNYYGNDRVSKRFDACKLQKQKQLEEVALDLLNGYWDNGRKVNDKVNDGNYDDRDEDEDEDEDEGFSCSSSDLFELDHLSLIGDELPVYETTRFDPKIM